jgi:DNA-binding NarL/FixJ family response regulator
VAAPEALREDQLGFRVLTMMEVRDVLRRLGAGQSLREIARTTGLDRKTVRLRRNCGGRRLVRWSRCE